MSTTTTETGHSEASGLANQMNLAARGPTPLATSSATTCLAASSINPKLRWVWVWLGLLSWEDVCLGVEFVDTSMLVVFGFGCYD